MMNLDYIYGIEYEVEAEQCKECPARNHCNELSYCMMEEH